jgi:hypothetical protein
MRLHKIDESIRNDHPFIEANDFCYYLGEYFPYNQGTDQQNRTKGITSEIQNLKKSLDRRGRPEYLYKGLAIDLFAQNLKSIFKQSALEQFSFVPAPPSKSRADPMYDDRLVQVLKRVSDQLDLRDVFSTVASRAASHASNTARLTSDSLADTIEFNPSQFNGARPNIMIFDDVLTTGKTFKTCKAKLLDHDVNLNVHGLFLARTYRSYVSANPTSIL